MAESGANAVSSWCRPTAHQTAREAMEFSLRREARGCGATGPACPRARGRALHAGRSDGGQSMRRQRAAGSAQHTTHNTHTHENNEWWVCKKLPDRCLTSPTRPNRFSGRGAARGRGRGAFYKAKYGGGGARGGHQNHANGTETPAATPHAGPRDWDQLQRDLRSIDGQQYGEWPSSVTST